MVLIIQIILQQFESLVQLICNKIPKTRIFFFPPCFSKSEEFSSSSHFSVSSLFLSLKKISYSICLSDLKCQVGISCRPLPLALIIHACQNQLPAFTSSHQSIGLVKEEEKKSQFGKKLAHEFSFSGPEGKGKLYAGPLGSM